MTLTEFAREHAFYKGHEELTPDLFKKYLITAIYDDKIELSKNKWAQFIYHRNLCFSLKFDLNFEIVNILIQLVESGYNLHFTYHTDITYSSEFFIEFITSDLIQKFTKYDNLFQLLVQTTFPSYFDIADIGKIDTLLQTATIPLVVLEKFLRDDNFDTNFSINRFIDTDNFITY